MWGFLLALFWPGDGVGGDDTGRNPRCCATIKVNSRTHCNDRWLWTYTPSEGYNHNHNHNRRHTTDDTRQTTNHKNQKPQNPQQQQQHSSGGRPPCRGQGSPLRVASGVCRCSVTSPIMGDAASGVVARRTCPSGVASFGRVTHAPADPRALYRAI